MSISSLIVKIGAQDSEIQNALASIGQKARSLDVDLKKLGGTAIGAQAKASLDNLNASVTALRANQQRLATQAVLTAQGIAAIGGPARLTQRELDNLSRKVRDGLDAFRALGQQAPIELQKVATALQAQRASLQTGLPTSELSAFGSGLISSFIAPTAIIAGFVASAKAALDYADALTKLKDQTSINVESLQRLEAIAVPSGNTLEEVADAVSKFQKNIAQDNPQTLRSIQALGLSIEHIRSLAPDEQFIAIAKAIQSIKDPAEQTRIAVELFGKSGSQLLPTLKADVDALKDSTFRMSEGSIKAIDDLGDGFSRWAKTAKNAIFEVVGATVADITGAAVAAQADLQRRATPHPIAPINIPLIADLRAGLDETNAFNLLTQGILDQTKATEALIEARKKLAAFNLTLTGATAAQDLALLTQAFKALSAEEQRHPEVMRRFLAAFQPLAAILGPTGIPQDVEELVRGLVDLGHADDVLAGKFRANQKPLVDAGMSLQELQNLAKGLAASGLIPAIQGLDALQAAWKRQDDALKAVRTQIGQLAPDLSQLAKQHIAEVQSGTEDVTKATDDWKDSISGLARSFTQLAQIAGPTLAPIARTIGVVLGSFDLAGEAAKTFEKGLDNFNKKDYAKGLSQVAAALATVTVSFLQATGSTSRLQNVIGGAISGAATGFQFGGVYGAIGGAIAGGVLGALRDAGDDAKREGYIVGLAFGGGITKGLAEQLISLRDLVHEAEGDFRGEFVLGFKDIVAQIGGLRAGNIGNLGIQFTSALITGLRDGVINTGQAVQALDQNFAEFVRAGTSRAGVLNAQIVNLIKFNRTLGDGYRENSQIIKQFIGSQVDSLIDRLQNFADIFKKAFDAKNTKLLDILKLSKGAAIGLAGAIAAAFKELVDAGTPILDIATRLLPLIDQLDAQFKASGVTGGKLFDDLRATFGLLKDEVAGPVIQAITDLGSTLVSLSNIGDLTQETFSGITDQIAVMFNKLVGLGYNPRQVLILLQRPLQQIWELAHDFGLAVDDATQALLDQAVAARIVGEAHRPVDEQILDVNKDILDVLTRIAHVLGADIPDAVSVAGKAFEDLGKQMDVVFRPRTPIVITISDPNNPGGPPIQVPVPVPPTGPQLPRRPPIGLQEGSHGLMDFGPGTLAVLHHREAVVPEEEYRQLLSAPSSVKEWDLPGHSGLSPADRARRAAAGLDGPIEIHLTGNVYLDGHSVGTVVLEHGVDSIARDKRGLGTKFVRALRTVGGK